jgi:hypothetical protein
MFARKVAVFLKPNTLEIFTQLVDGELLPWLRTQEGFLDLIILADVSGVEVQAISFWDKEEQECHNTGYPVGVLKMLQQLLDGVPRGKRFEIVSSTLEKFAPPKEEGTERAVPKIQRSELRYSMHETNP